MRLKPAIAAGFWRRLCAAVVFGLCMPLAGAAPSVEPLRDFGSNPGNLEAYIHAPPAGARGLPVVVALHGCGQTASAMGEETGLLAAAERAPFVLVLPQQRPANNEKRCFNWFRPDDNRAGGGEVASIAQMVDSVLTRRGADYDRVYVLGFSAGGSMAVTMLANHPQRFAAGAVIAGTPYGCNRPAGVTHLSWWWTNLAFGEAASASVGCGLLGYSSRDRSASVWQRYVVEAAGRPPDHWPRVSIWHGTADEVVDPANMGELVEQWTAVHGIDSRPDSRRRVATAQHATFEDSKGRVRVETYRLPGFGHGYPVAPDSRAPGCGTATGEGRRAGVCATRHILRFWGLTP